MPLPPLSVSLSNGQKTEAMKVFRKRYAEELEQTEARLTELMTNQQTADFLAQYIGDQPELAELKSGAEEVAKLEKRRQYLSALIERLDAYTPKQPEIKPVLGDVGGKASGVRKF